MKTQPMPCMGGWCALREHCPHYHSASTVEPFERLCNPGADGISRVAIHAPQRPAAFPVPSQETQP